MPSEVIDRPNPQPLDSQISDSVSSLAVKLGKLHISENDLQALQDFRRASNYIAAGKYTAQLGRYVKVSGLRLKTCPFVNPH